MKERIVVVPDSGNLAVTLGYLGVNVFNMRFVTPFELAELVSARNGFISDKKLIKNSEELSYLKDIISSVPYFISNKLADIRNIQSSVNSLRKLITEDEVLKMKENLDKGIFKDKNNAIYEVFSEYLNNLNKDNKTDSIGYIRSVIERSLSIDSDLYLIKEFKYKPLEIKLAESVNENYKEISLFELFDTERKELRIESYRNCYGISNEVSLIIDQIFNNGNADESVIAVSDYHIYADTLYDLAVTYGFLDKVSFARGITLAKTYPGKLLELYRLWTDGNYNYESFLKMIYSPYFNLKHLNELLSSNDQSYLKKLYEVTSKLRLTDHKEINDLRISDFDKASDSKINNFNELKIYLSDLKIIALELSKPLNEFIEQYAVIRANNSFDKAALGTIFKELKTVTDIGYSLTEDIFDMLLKKMVAPSLHKEGTLYLTTIESAVTSLRKDLYVAGLSASDYPGSPKENPLVLDTDLDDFNCSDLKSDGIIKTKQQNLFNLIELANACNNRIYLSYPGLNVSELKNSNASSLLFEIFKKEKGENKELDEFKKQIINVSYFEPNLSKNRIIGEAYNNSIITDFKVNKTDTSNKSGFLRKKYSPSALNTFFNCRKQFLYRNILYIPEENEFNPYETVAANEQGTLAHSLMEYLAENKDISRSEFLNISKDAFNNLMKINVPLIEENINKAMEEFLEMMSNGYDFDQQYKRELILKEEDKTAVHKESGVMIHGFPDRVEKDENGNAVIIDFKTERKLSAHKTDDVETCLQVLIYAYIIEETTGIKVDHGEYRMLRFKNGIISCRYDDNAKKELTEKLEEFKDALKTGNFEIEPMSESEEKDKCKYCGFGRICGKKVVKDEE